jgi:hypothetical protein
MRRQYTDDHQILDQTLPYFCVFRRVILARDLAIRMIDTMVESSRRGRRRRRGELRGSFVTRAVNSPPGLIRTSSLVHGSRVNTVNEKKNLNA